MGSSNKTMSAREAAFKVLGSYRRNNAWSDLALDGIISNCSLAANEAALATHIVNGVLQNMALCDFYAAHFSNNPLKKLEPRVLDILRLSIYQIVFLTRIPHNAIVNEGVALTKKYSNQRAAGYINAVLRKISKASLEGTLPVVEGNATQRLSIKYSHPEWLVKEIWEILGQDGTEAVLKENNSDITPHTAQVNTLITGTDEVIALLASEGVEAKRHAFLDDCVEFRSAGNIVRLEAFKKGYIYIQDVAARLAVIAASPKNGDFVIDGCAAPGGKSFSAAIMMENSGRIISCDIHGAKLRHIEHGAERLKIGIVEAINQDASIPASDSREKADVVIADVPCSGFGIIRKKPEIRYKQKHDVEGLPELQKRILSSLAQYVVPGGTLLYSTCTMIRRENEDVIESFLSENNDFSTESFLLPGIGDVPGGMITLWPHIHGTDGFFICKLRKV